MDHEFERTPLLRQDLQRDTLIAETSRRRRICASVFCLELLTVLAYDVLDLPLVRFLEQAICERYYAASFVYGFVAFRSNESRCKVPEVQDELAYLLGVRVALNAVPCLLMSIPWARLSDRKGRRLAIGLGCTGELLALAWVIAIGAFPRIFNVRLIWLSAIFLFVGGGVRYLLCLYFTAIADIMEPARRNRYMFWLYSLIHVSGLVVPPIGALLMKLDWRIPFVIALVSMMMRYAILFLMPETLPKAPLSKQQDRNGPVAATSSVASTSTESYSHIRHGNILKTARTLVSIPGIWFCFLSFLLKRIAFSSENLIYQYTSEVLKQRLDEVVWIRVALGTGASLMTALVLPSVSHILSRRAFPTQFVNLWVIRFSLSVVIIGFVVMWLARHPIQIGVALLFCGMGEGLEPSLEALASSTIHQASNANLFAFFSVIDTIAKIIGGPVMAAMLSIRDNSGVSFGACFLLSACLFVMLWVLSWTLSWKKMEDVSKEIGAQGS